MTSSFAKQSLFGASVITVVAGFLSRPVGFLREAVIASYFGTGAQLDLFLLAIAVPELLAAVLYAALPTAVIPALQNAGDWPAGRERRLFFRGLTGLALTLAITAGLIYLARTVLLALWAPDLSPDAVARGERLIGILAGIVLFRGLEAYFRGWLNNAKQFLGPALSPFVLNAVLLAAVILLYDKCEIEALAYGWLIGTALLAMYNGILVLRMLLPRMSSGEAPARLNPLFGMVVTVAVVEFISLAYPAIDRAIAARLLGEGQIAALRYGYYLVQLPPGLLVVGFSLASYPWISDLSADSDRPRLTQLYSQSLGLIVYAMLPLVAGLLWFAPEIVRVAFERGAFDIRSAELTTDTFFCYTTGLLFYSVYIYQMRYYYARRQMTRIGVILLLMLVVKLVGSVVLAESYQHRGLALATSLTWLLGTILMTSDLHKSASLSLLPRFRTSTLKALVAVVPCLALWYILQLVWAVDPDVSLSVQAVTLAAHTVAGLVVYVAVGMLLRLEEPRRIWEMIRSRLLRKDNSS